jgi:hypothetical protein
MFRKRRRPTPHYQIPSPYNPIFGNHATLRQEGISPYCALMQVAEQDVFDDYVICRGFDTRIGRFIDYEPNNFQKPGISVAKPFGSRKKDLFEIGEIYPAFLPMQGTMQSIAQYTPASPVGVDWRLGQNPGVLDPPNEDGQPESLGDSIVLLYDHNGKAINWMLVSGGPPEPQEKLLLFQLTEDIFKCDQAKGIEVDSECFEIRTIMLRDLAGLCDLVTYPLGQQYAPENAMGWAQNSGEVIVDPDDPEEEDLLEIYDIVSISLSGCCGDSEVCPEIPHVPIGKIGVSAEDIKYVLGYDEDGCLVRITVGTCCDEEEEPEDPEDPGSGGSEEGKEPEEEEEEEEGEEEEEEEGEEEGEEEKGKQKDPI